MVINRGIGIEKLSSIFGWGSRYSLSTNALENGMNKSLFVGTVNR